MKNWLLLSTLCISAAHAADPYNTYRFDRANHDSGVSSDSHAPWYEWWYYKVVLDDGTAFYWVYGVINPWDKNSTFPASEAYVSIGNFATREIEKKSFGTRDFTASYDETKIQIHDFQATDREIHGEMNGDIKWDVAIEKEWGWNAMGWGMPFNHLSNISWYPAQASALMSGEIEFKGKKYSFKNAKGYQDRNWGSGLPDWWFWLVGNEFRENSDATLACGGGLPRFGGIALKAVVNCGFKSRGREYNFRSTDMQAADYELRFGKWDVTLTNLTHKIEIKASAPAEKFMDLIFISPHNEVFHDLETLNGDIDVNLYRLNLRGGWELKEHLTSDRAGIEYGSPTAHP